MKATITPLTRIITIVTALSLIGVIFLPLWSIELTAPQYPEGLGGGDGVNIDQRVVNWVGNVPGTFKNAKSQMQFEDYEKIIQLLDLANINEIVELTKKK